MLFRRLIEDESNNVRTRKGTHDESTRAKGTNHQGLDSRSAELEESTNENKAMKASGPRIYRRRRTPFQKKAKRRPEPMFYPTLAMYTGYCGICGTSYQTGEAIYRCRKTESTRAMRVHEACYIQKARASAPSRKASPSEAELRRQREAASEPTTLTPPIPF